MESSRGVIRASAAGVLIAIGLTQTGIAQQTIRQGRAAEAEYALLDALNDCVQDRFKDLSTGLFGLSRVARPMPAGPHRFFAENLNERSALDHLEAAGLRVVVYLAGRAVLAGATPAVKPPSAVALIARQSSPDAARPAVQGPISVTPRSSGAALPDMLAAGDLLEESRRAILAFAEVESTEFARGSWRFVARPLRASADACLSCHASRAPVAAGTTLRMGDALGAVLYGYRQVP